MVVGGGQGLVGEVAGALAYPRLAKKYFSDAVSSYVPYFFFIKYPFDYPFQTDNLSLYSVIC